MADSVATNSLIHGYNKSYQIPLADSATRFHAFPLEAKGTRMAIASFAFMKVAGMTVRHSALDVERACLFLQKSTATRQPLKAQSAAALYLGASASQPITSGARA